jgi:hypothetical protein
MNDYVDPPQDDDTPGGPHPIAYAFAAFAVYIALAAIWIFRAEIWS